MTVLLPKLVSRLKENELYELVSRYVRAAEKYAGTHDIDKKQYVLELLGRHGVKTTPLVEALIESAVEELDIAADKAIKTDKG